MKDASTRDWVSITRIGAFIVGWVVLFLTSPDELIRELCVEQAWLVVFLLSVIGALGAWVFFTLVTRARGPLAGRSREKARGLEEWLDERRRWQVSGLTCLWLGVLPLANNVLTGSLAPGGCRFRHILLPLFLENVTFPAGVAWLATTGIEIYG